MANASDKKDQGALLPQAQTPPDNYMQPNPDEPNTGAAESDVAAGISPPSHALEPSSKETSKAKLAKMAGVDADDVIGFSAERNTIVTAQGQKFRLAADGKTVVRLSGPAIE